MPRRHVRSHARSLVLQALYCADLIPICTISQSIIDLLLTLDEDKEGLGILELDVEDRAFCMDLAQGVAEKLKEVDLQIDTASTNWRIQRMPTVDRNILRLAAYELMFMPEIPVSVTINEAVELAKRFGTAESKAFINGILDRIAHEMGRGGRAQRKS